MIASIFFIALSPADSLVPRCARLTDLVCGLLAPAMPARRRFSLVADEECLEIFATDPFIKFLFERKPVLYFVYFAVVRIYPASPFPLTVDEQQKTKCCAPRNGGSRCN
jgi:hypothetical protein